MHQRQPTIGDDDQVDRLRDVDGQSANALCPRGNECQALSPDDWIKDQRTGCAVVNPNPMPNESVTWSSPCESGKAHGEDAFNPPGSKIRRRIVCC